MQTEEIRLEVPADVAQRYRQGPPELQERVRAAVARLVGPRRAQVEGLVRVMDAMADTARQRGLTEERLDELLNGPDA